MKRQIVEIDEEKCDGCGLCVPSCAEGALRVLEGKARLVSDLYCDGLGACLGECPQGAIRVVTRKAEEFDQEAVRIHLEGLRGEAPHAAPSPGPGPLQSPAKDSPPAFSCPSSALRQFAAGGLPAPALAAGGPAAEPSRLGHWPVQIMLVPPVAPFLRDADLLVAADCVPFAYASFHRDFLAGKALLVGCPKLDDSRAYVERFTALFRETPIRSLSTIVMEVPCCAGLVSILEEALRQSGKEIPLEKIVIGIRGELKAREPARHVQE